MGRATPLDTAEEESKWKNILHPFTCLQQLICILRVAFIACWYMVVSIQCKYAQIPHWLILRNPLSQFQYIISYVSYPSLSVSCRSDMFWWHTLRVYTWAQIHFSIVTPIPGFNQSAKINPQLIQSHNQAGWGYGILNPPAGKSPALILQLIWNEFTPGCGRNTDWADWCAVLAFHQDEGPEKVWQALESKSF